ncbi:MAG: hypothetical protein HC835_07345 [Oscillatoriales cyanobacterium RM2_1_1]|nr:hypothetical protein [Oscillatoriales cyanobacterium SM2_3_0]NJO45452.1 hypothetical protein [Oscillatoriales cyanobacterium RM2_1_1]
MTLNRQDQYVALIEQLLQCPNGKEPEILDAQTELIDPEFIKTVVQVAMAFAHEGNQESAQFLFHIARELSKQLELYPQLSSETSS